MIPIVTFIIKESWPISIPTLTISAASEISGAPPIHNDGRISFALPEIQALYRLSMMRLETGQRGTSEEE
jgi:hypothetical protein